MTAKENEGHKSRKHRTFGGSTANQWVNCPGWAKLVSTLPPQVVSDDMRDGTRAHEISEIVVDAFLKNRLEGTELTTPTLAEDEGDMLSHAQAYCDSLWENVLQKSITGKAYGLEDEMVLSETLDIGGPADFWAVYRDVRGLRVGYIVDYKYGYKFVDPNETAQLPLYAVSLRKEMRDQGVNLDVIFGAIYQPRGEEPVYREAKWTSKQLDRWEKKFLKAVEKSYSKDSKVKTGSWCEGCRGKTQCKAYLKKLEEKGQLALASPQDFKWLPTPETIDDETLVKLIKHDGEIIDFLKKCRQYAISRHTQGKPLEGLKVVGSKGKRSWRKETEEVAQALMEMGIEDPFKNPPLKNLGDIQKQFKKIGVDAKIVDELLNNLCTKGGGNPILVDIMDPREALEVANYADLFLDETKTEIIETE